MRIDVNRSSDLWSRLRRVGVSMVQQMWLLVLAHAFFVAEFPVNQSSFDQVFEVSLESIMVKVNRAATKNIRASLF